MAKENVTDDLRAELKTLADTPGGSTKFLGGQVERRDG